ncbi:MAG: hypothetical protein EZS28_055154, partial [Streblomastix strix]
MERLEFIFTSADREDNENVSKGGEGQGVGGDCGSDVERVVMDESSESDVSEESGPEVSRIDSEAGKV